MIKAILIGENFSLGVLLTVSKVIIMTGNMVARTLQKELRVLYPDAQAERERETLGLAWTFEP